MITSSSSRALQGQRVRLYLSILRFWVLLSLFQGVFLVRSLTFFFLFVALLFLIASVANLALDS